MLRFMGETVSEDEIRDIIEEADVDRDGLIDYTEFFNMMMRWKNREKYNFQILGISIYHYLAYMHVLFTVACLLKNFELVNA